MFTPVLNINNTHCNSTSNKYIISVLKHCKNSCFNITLRFFTKSVRSSILVMLLLITSQCNIDCNTFFKNSFTLNNCTFFYIHDDFNKIFFN